VIVAIEALLQLNPATIAARGWRAVHRINSGLAFLRAPLSEADG
jgi:hypothetical protein